MKIFFTVLLRGIKMMYFTFLLMISLLIQSAYSAGQVDDTTEYDLTMEKAVMQAINNNPLIKIASLEAEQSTYEKPKAMMIDPAEILYRSGSLYGTETGRYFEINQSFGSLINHIQLLEKARISEGITRINYELAKKELICEVKSAYTFWNFISVKLSLLEEEKNLYDKFKGYVEMRYKSGDISLLQKSDAETKIIAVKRDYLSTFDDLNIAANTLNQLMESDSNYKPSPGKLEMYSIVKPSDSASFTGKTYLSFLNGKYELAHMDEKLAASYYFPGISAGFFHQDIGSIHNLNGWQIGISIPIDLPQQIANTKEKKIQMEVAALKLDYQTAQLHTTIENLLFDLNKSFRQIRYFEESALANADIILNTAHAQLNSEEIDYAAFLESVSSAIKIKIDYYKAINNYNQKAYQLELYAD